ncbi:chaperonin GroEL [Vigna unguiculata]|uniref:Chaperonin GroEL n=1 Tax=Vigna unguiculata TaxID=3917 RepID=A0A4D6N1V5_VIGUN|nr:chaperonin GroEL [Vigna unguiculata]
MFSTHSNGCQQNVVASVIVRSFVGSNASDPDISTLPLSLSRLCLDANGRKESLPPHNCILARVGQGPPIYELGLLGVTTSNWNSNALRTLFLSIVESRLSWSQSYAAKDIKFGVEAQTLMLKGVE